MTRSHTSKPAWTWSCDHCGRESELGWTQPDLPGPDAMRKKGWHVAAVYGDLCPECNTHNNRMASR